MLIKKTMWLFVKALVIGGVVVLSLVYVADEPASRAEIAQHTCFYVVCW